MACASSKGSDDVAPPTGTDDIIGGVDAKSASLNAVGAIMYKDPTTQQLQVLCSGTLISKDAVITAKHCAVQFDAAAPNPAAPDSGVQQVTETRYIDYFAEMYFAIGYDSATAKMVRLKSVDLCNDYQGGTAQLGCDVSIYRTADPVEDVTPIPVASGPVAAELVGKKATGLGYGTQNQTQTALGTRKAGSFTIRATTGQFMTSLYPTGDAFVAELQKEEGAGWVNNNGDLVNYFYTQTIKDGYEVFVGGGTEAQACHGDSGGPLLYKVDGKLTVLGVTSTVGFAGTKLPCNMGAIYATFGPAAQDLIKSNLAADPCAGIPAEGRCEGDVAVRCTRADEGARRVVKNDCSELLGHCVPAQASDAGDAGPGEVSCGD